ncbi:molybdopterin molybdotransferase MoeA [Vibrio sp. WJH972]
MGSCDAPGLLAIDKAIEQMLLATSVVNTSENLPLEECLGRVLALDVCSPINVPPFDNSAMDGYAVRIDDLKQNLTLEVAGRALAGQPFQAQWPAMSAVRIMTGAKIPSGCDAVIMQEYTTVTDNKVTFELDATQLKPLSNIRPTGDDLHSGDIVLGKGHRITPRDLPLIASLGIPTLDVYSRPKVAFFSTGDELKPLGTTLNEGDIYDSNRYGIEALLSRFGCEAIDLGIIPDSQETIEQAFDKAQAMADVVITSGGVSVGEADYTKDILARLGTINFWKLAIKPGKPFAFGALDGALFCGLPGNPVSAMVTMYVLVQPLLAKLSGEIDWQAPPSIPATSKSNFKKGKGRTDYQRGVYWVEDGKLVVETAGNQSSGAFTAMSAANCFIVLEQERGKVEMGESVNIEPFNSSLY